MTFRTGSLESASTHSAERFHPRTISSEQSAYREVITPVRTALIVSDAEETRQALSDTVRESLRYRVLQAGSVSEGRYLTAVEGRISLLLTGSAAKEYQEFARWFLETHPAAMVLVADGSLWELVEGSQACEQVLMAKSYTDAELSSLLRRSLAEPKAVST